MVRISARDHLDPPAKLLMVLLRRSERMAGRRSHGAWAVWRTAKDHDEAEAEGGNGNDAGRDNTAREVAVQLGMSVSTLYAYVDAEGRPREHASDLLGKRGHGPR